MKKTILIMGALALLTACQPSEDEKAAPLMNKIDSLYKAKNYQATLNAITELRTQHPKAIESREKALKIWQEASLKMAQDDIGLTDSALQATIRQINVEKSLYRKNMLRVKRDSLQTRYQALVGTVLVIHRKQAEK
jgi:hypothetical protein